MAFYFWLLFLPLVVLLADCLIRWRERRLRLPTICQYTVVLELPNDPDSADPSTHRVDGCLSQESAIIKAIGQRLDINEVAAKAYFQLNPYHATVVVGHPHYDEF
jgi:hypothetical protein